MWNINGVITVSCWAIGLSAAAAAAPVRPTCFISHPPLLRGAMSIVLWRAELIMAAEIQAYRSPGVLSRRLLNVEGVSREPPSKDEMIKKPTHPD